MLVLLINKEIKEMKSYLQSAVTCNFPNDFRSVDAGSRSLSLGMQNFLIQLVGQYQLVHFYLTAGWFQSHMACQ